MCSAHSLRLPVPLSAPSHPSLLRSEKGGPRPFYLRFPKSRFSLGGSGYFPLFCSRALARKWRENVCAERVDFALGLISRAVRPALSAGAGLVEGPK